MCCQNYPCWHESYQNYKRLKAECGTSCPCCPKPSCPCCKKSVNVSLEGTIKFKNCW